MTFIYRLLINILKFLLISLPLQLIGSICLLVYLPFHRKKVKETNSSIKLPYLLRWFDCADLYLEFKRNNTTYLKVYGSGFWSCYFWLAWRNPINYFSYKYLGFYLNDFTKKSIVKQEGNVKNKNHPGYYFIEIESNNKIYYEYYYAFKFLKNKLFIFRLGWKIIPAKNNEFVQDVFMINPLKTIK